MGKGFSYLQNGLVKPEWIDQNGHMNSVHYMRIFDDGAHAMMKVMGFADSASPQKQYAIVASRINIVYRKELMSGESWQLETGLLSVNPRYLTLVHRLTSKNSVRAYCYIRGVIFCTDKRSSKALDDQDLERARQFVVPGLKDPFAVVSE